MILQSVNDIAALCAQQGIKEAILSPGSRNAPLTLAFTRHPHIRTRTISDERSAAFIALGMAQQLKQPVVLICTSGTAAYNYAPAVAEAFFQQIPLLVLTADRPPEWIDQLDGQTIRQQNIYGAHAKKAWQLPADLRHPDAQWQVNRSLNEAINLSRQFPAGPVHINIPLREPFYPAEGERWYYSEEIRTIENWAPASSLSNEQWSQLELEWKSFGRKLIVGGQQQPDAVLLKQLQQTARVQKIPVVADIISNLHGIESAIRLQDSFLSRSNEPELEALQPELLITFGKSVISKNLKLFLRKYQPKAHWHLQPAGEVADTFQSLSRIIPMEPARFFMELNNRGIKAEERVKEQKVYRQEWFSHQEKSEKAAAAFFQPTENWGEFHAVQLCLGQLPPHYKLHLANSTAVRYANFIGLYTSQKNIEVLANRGTSGIDGSTSTALGAALADKSLHLLITGDMAFFYDRNALWNNYLPPNLRIMVLNNHAGGIFRLIKGPGEQPELEEYFETRQPLTAAATAREFGLQYFHCSSREALETALPDFLSEEGGPKLLEVETDSKTNAELLKRYKQGIHAYE
ncbi:2-succinyl-5-enolpyruvyl-6-hydroxy-3-cyclohexene-1-carboxylic-acid synthase [Nafulsella turpanensis]|uniref:2-succinyl-5-enolpyruvyl-6-hydroxy-3- cyclohexene-1-carboxylic-acid synthase n=1 Tax=Nafulsella turpanensis TaxID=1265690 RepID=UPI000345E954|nr:2-succinyl-5-enolpyruvyl-6-hydroxy-3-cyclohexene-1-carboxylic-acid synthase [Nafulsella turpanensis]